MGPAEVMREVRNCFVTGKCEGVWRLEDGRLSPGELLMPGEWIALSGSCLNDGIWQLDGEGRLVGETRDERFTGEVWFLHPPAEFLALCEEIDRYNSELFGFSMEELAAARLPWNVMF